MSLLSDFWNYDFMLAGLISAILLSILMGLISPFVVAKKMSFMGESIAHSTLLSVGLTGLLISSASNATLFAGTLVFTLLFTSFLAYKSYQNKLPQDGFLGLFLAITLAAGMLLFHFSPQLSPNLMSFLFGSMATSHYEDSLFLAIALILIALYLKKNWSAWIYWTLDPEGSLRENNPNKKFHFLFYIFLCLIIVAGVKLAGIIVVNGLLIFPGYFALKNARHAKQIWPYSLLFSLTASVLGLILANGLNAPPGPMMIATAFVLNLLPRLRKIS